MLASAEEIAESAKDRAALDHVLRKREDRARITSTASPENSDGRAARAVRGALSHLLLPLVPPLVIADLGAGEGELAQLLAAHARKVIAVDSSEKMVDFGRKSSKEHGCKNLEYRLGDIQNPPIDAESVDDGDFFSQALHHAANPGGALVAAHRILRPGGRVLILDLLAHNFEQARELYADLWLGFSEVELHQMLAAAGFEQIRVAVVARATEGPPFQTVLAEGVRRAA